MQNTKRPNDDIDSSARKKINLEIVQEKPTDKNKADASSNKLRPLTEIRKYRIDKFT